VQFNDASQVVLAQSGGKPRSGHRAHLTYALGHTARLVRGVTDQIRTGEAAFAP
jgi:hypothetical protein